MSTDKQKQTCPHCGIDMLGGIRVHYAEDCRDHLKAEVSRLRKLLVDQHGEHLQASLARATDAMLSGRTAR